MAVSNKITTTPALFNLDSPKIQILTAKISELKKTLFRDTVETVIEIGEYLTEAKSILSHGDWLKWLAENVHFSERTAQRYMQLAEFKESNTTHVSYLKDSGIFKLYKIAALPEPQRRKVLFTKQFRIPGRQQKKSIKEMSRIEFYQVINSLTGGKRRVAPDTQSRAVRKLLRKTISLLEELRNCADKISSAEKALLTAEIQHLAEQIDNLKLWTTDYTDFSRLEIFEKVGIKIINKVF